MLLQTEEEGRKESGKGGRERGISEELSFLKATFSVIFDAKRRSLYGCC